MIIQDFVIYLLTYKNEVHEKLKYYYINYSTYPIQKKPIDN